MEYREKISGFLKKHRSKLMPLLIAVIGIVFLMIAGGSDSSDAVGEDDLTRQVREFLEEIDGVGECRVMISYEYKESGYFSSDEKGSVRAVAVACKGAKKVEVRKKITDILCTLFNIGANRVNISELD